MQNPNPVEPDTSTTGTLPSPDALPEQVPVSVVTPEVPSENVTAPAPILAPEPVTTPAPEPELAPDLTTPSTEPTNTAPKKEGNKSMVELIVLVVIVVILLGLGAWYYMSMQA